MSRKKHQNTGAVYSTAVSNPLRVKLPGPTSSQRVDALREQRVRRRVPVREFHRPSLASGGCAAPIA